MIDLRQPFNKQMHKKDDLNQTHAVMRLVLKYSENMVNNK